MVSGAGARQGRGDRDGREIDPRQRRDRQQAEAEDAERDDRRRDQRRHHRPADTEFGERHRSGSGLPGRAARPAFRPTAATARRRRRFRRRPALPRSPTCPATVRSTLTGWTLAAPSLTTNTKLPLWLRCTATVGTTTASSLRDDELGRNQRARPQRLVLVVHDAAHGDHAGGRHRRCFRPSRPCRSRSADGPGWSRSTLGGALGHRLAQIDQHALRNGEGHIDRRHLVDDGKRRGIGRAHEIADLHIGGADPARERRADRGVALLDLQIFQRGLIGLDGAGQDVGPGSWRCRR